LIILSVPRNVRIGRSLPTIRTAPDESNHHRHRNAGIGSRNLLTLSYSASEPPHMRDRDRPSTTWLPLRSRCNGRPPGVAPTQPIASRCEYLRTPLRSRNARAQRNGSDRVVANGGLGLKVWRGGADVGWRLIRGEGGRDALWYGA
jgi:hypothetical protein